MSTSLRLVVWAHALLAIVAAFVVLSRQTPASASADPKDSDMTTVRVRVFNKAGVLIGPIAMPKVIKTDEEWRAQLTPPQYQVARAKGTEAPFCGTLLDNKKQGVYTCVCCDLPLFSSDSKFNSGTGWPSFFQPISKENVAQQVDRSHFQMATEILCARCDAHLGHVFEDGPRPTGLRFCLNSESLEFTASDALATLADPAAETPAPLAKPSASAAPAGAPGSTRAEAVFAGGCFWCTEAVFEELEGVIDAVSGYAGGSADTANYKAVCTGTTGHAESIKIIYDPTKIDYLTLLKVHFATHDPTSLNRQGADAGTQYRSAIFYANETERQAAEAFIRSLEESHKYAKPIVTTLEPLKAFYPAETYHQNYVCQNPMDGYVQGVAMPKVEKVRKNFADKLKEKSPLAP